MNYADMPMPGAINVPQPGNGMKQFMPGTGAGAISDQDMMMLMQALMKSKAGVGAAPMGPQPAQMPPMQMPIGSGGM